MPTLTEPELDRAFLALADGTRRSIVARLSRGDATVGELAEPFPMSLQAVSKHITVLEKAGLITRGRDAQRRPCSLNREAVEPLLGWLDVFRTRTEERFSRIDELLAEDQIPEPTSASHPISAATHTTTAKDEK